MHEPKRASDQQAQAFLREGEKLIEGRPVQPDEAASDNESGHTRRHGAARFELGYGLNFRL
jgi:hypothetical protein